MFYVYMMAVGREREREREGGGGGRFFIVKIKMINFFKINPRKVDTLLQRNGTNTSKNNIENLKPDIKKVDKKEKALVTVSFKL